MPERSQSARALGGRKGGVNACALVSADYLAPRAIEDGKAARVVWGVE